VVIVSVVPTPCPSFPRRARWVVVLAAGVVGCSATPREQVVTDCSLVVEVYDTEGGTIEDYEPADPAAVPDAPAEATTQAAPAEWFSYGDATPVGGPDAGALEGSGTSYAIEEIRGGSPCEPQEQRQDKDYALVLRSRGKTDWGSGFGSWGFASGPGEDASGWHGLAFWGRAPLSRTITIALGDSTSEPIRDENEELVEGSCIPSGDAGTPTEPNAGPVGANPVGPSLAGYDADVPGPNDCENYFQRPIVVSRDWALHVIPFELFAQSPAPNRSPGGIDIESIRSLRIFVPKGANLELWIDEFTWYRRR
jgi:hypothetical protein